MENKFLFLKYSLVFSQLLTLIIFSVYLSHFFEENLSYNEVDYDTQVIEDYFQEDIELWDIRVNGLILFLFLATLYCITTFGIYSVIEERVCATTLYFSLFVIWILVFHAVINIYGFGVPKKALVLTEILSTSLSFVFILTLKRFDNLENVRINDHFKSVSTISYDIPPYNPHFIPNNLC